MPYVQLNLTDHIFCFITVWIGYGKLALGMTVPAYCPLIDQHPIQGLSLQHRQLSQDRFRILAE